MAVRTSSSLGIPSKPVGIPNINESLVRFQDQRAKELMEDIDKIGEPIFQPSDITATSDMFAKIVRMFCVDQHITYDYLNSRHRAYCESICMLCNQINYDRNNFKRALLKSTMTKAFFENFCMIMGITVTDMSISIMTPAGVSVTYAISEAPLMAKQPATHMSKTSPTDM